MKPLNPEQFSVNSLIWLVAAKGILSGGTLGPLKDYQAPTAGGPGAKAPGRKRSFIL